MNNTPVIHIVGERNSGTKYIGWLINKTLRRKTGSGSVSVKFKHNPIRVSEHDVNNTIFVFMVRPIRPWLVSMYNNPYSLSRPFRNIGPDRMTLTDFASTPPTWDALRAVWDHAIHVPAYDALMLTVVQRRYLMWNEMHALAPLFPNVVFANLEAVQADPRGFICDLNRVYGLSDTFDPRAPDDFFIIPRQPSPPRDVMIVDDTELSDAGLEAMGVNLSTERDIDALLWTIKGGQVVSKYMA